MNPYLELFCQGLGQFTGVFLGVVAGVAITFAVERFKDRRNWKQELKNLRFELDTNIAKIDGWLQEVVKWRNAVNGDNFAMYFGYFNLSSAIIATTNTMFMSGRLYDALTYEHIAKLQEVFKDLSIFGEQYLNNQIVQKKQLLAQLAQSGNEQEWHRSLKQQCILEIDFWETKLKAHKDALASVNKAVQDKIG
ncbi:MAG: hypothetical protein V1873_06550 [Verrucomicrobiota bacterium]